MPDSLTNSRPASTGPLISVVVPVHNGGEHLGACLDALAAACGDFEIIVVDDGSTDDSHTVARARGVCLLRLESRCGPAAARNRGALEARGEVLLFIDADVLVRPSTITRVATHFRARPALAALFGSYDDAPTAPNFISQYKNLLHHFVHQHGNSRAGTFWAGCGAVRRELFFRVGGFDEKRYIDSSVEDIELGCRLRGAGHEILLDRELQVRHLKRWTLWSLLRADIFRRARPWAKLMLEQGSIPDDLNLSIRERVAASATVAALALLACGLAFSLLFVPAAVALLAGIITLNRRLYVFFWQHGGPLFLAAAVALHLLYYCYSTATFACCWLAHACRRRREGGRSPARLEI